MSGLKFNPCCSQIQDMAFLDFVLGMWSFKVAFLELPELLANPMVLSSPCSWMLLARAMNLKTC